MRTRFRGASIASILHRRKDCQALTPLMDSHEFTVDRGFREARAIATRRHITGAHDAPVTGPRTPSTRGKMQTLIDVLRENATREDRAVTFVRASGEESVVSFPAL